jgi:DNA polymerase-1
MSLIESGDIYLPKPKYKYITDNDSAVEAINFLDKCDSIEIDTETTSLDPYKAKMSLLQIGVPNHIFVFDTRNDTEHSSLDLEMLNPILRNKKKLKILQNSAYDMKILKLRLGYYLENTYDTMLAEQLMHLGLNFSKADLVSLFLKYLGITMSKESRGTFSDYGQKFSNTQLEYAANDVSSLHMIKELQWYNITKESLQDVAKLEFDFVIPLCEMELNGIEIDTDKWRIIMSDVEKELVASRESIQRVLSEVDSQNTLFGVYLTNIDSNQQLKSALEQYGVNLPDTKEETLKKFAGIPVIDDILDYRKASKLVSTYGETLLAKINKVTGRLHTDFKQMVATGRMSSSKPNLQNIPKKQKYRSCFIARDGYSLITADMSGAELRILGNLSKDPVFVESYATGQDLHTRTASEIYDVHYDEVEKFMRNAAKAVNFGIIYGMSSVGLSRRLKITEKEAAVIINKYFSRYKSVKEHLDKSGKEAVMNRYSVSVSGRRRYYNMPPFDHPDHRKIKGGIERQGKNMPIQGCLIFDTNVKGVGYIGSCVGKSVSIETGFGDNNAYGVFSGSKEVYELKLSNGTKIGVSLDHKIPVCTRTSIVDKQVSEIDFENDLCIIPLNVVDGKKTDLSGYKYTKGHWRETYIEYKYPNIMNEELSFIIGCLIGDGNYSKYNNISFVCRDSQIELFNKFNLYIKSVFDYDVKITKSKKGNCVLFKSQVSSVVIRGFLKHIGMEYVVNRKKSIPEYFFTETVINKCNLLDGLFSTDGGVTKESGPNYTTVSEKLANDIHQLLFSIGISSNLKRYNNEYGYVYRIQIPKRFISRFLDIIGSSVNEKSSKLTTEMTSFKGKDHSLVPEFIPKTIYNNLILSDVYKSLSYNERCHLRRLKYGSCSFSSWRKFFCLMSDCSDKEYISKFLAYDFCNPVSLTKIGIKDTYDLICEKDPRYFVANGIIVHNSNADTIKKAMVFVVDRIKDYDARLLLTVHDEVIVEAKNEQYHEVAKIVENSLIDGFGHYFNLIPMQTDALVGPCWLKDKCENHAEKDNCGSTEMKFIPHSKYGTKLVCAKCGKEQD